jgi:hypothetical protein
MLSLSGLSPAEGEKLVSPNTLVEFTIVDTDGDGIDIDTLIVEIQGYRAVNGTTFSSGYDGTLSSITMSGDDYSVIIDPTTDFSIGEVVSLKIQVQDLIDSYFNFTYSFRIVPEEPILVSSNPAEDDILTSPQLLELVFEDIVDGVDPLSVNVSINGLDYIIAGIATVDPNGVLTEVRTTTDGVTVLIDPDEELRNNTYLLEYSVADPNGNTLRSEFVFEVRLPEAVLPDQFAQVRFAGYFNGIERVSDVGCGDAVLAEWGIPIAKSYNSEAFALVYQDEYRLSLFDGDPSYIATADTQQAYITGLSPGVTLSFGARAAEFPTGTFDPTGMVVEDPGFYRFPSRTTLTAQIDENSLVISVDSVSGYPAAGYIAIGSEAIRYTSISTVNNTFLVPSNGRGAFSSSEALHLSGDEVRLYADRLDENSAIVMSTPTYHDGYRSGRELEYTGFVVTDYDDDIHFFDGFDFCGWHDALPQEVLQDDSCGSYLGGEFNGWRGFNLYDRMLAREEVLLDQVGEPVVLLQRVWDGEVCTCMDLRKMSPKVKSCSECYGTGFIGGYTQYLNLRREDRRMMASFDETPEDLFHGEKEHLQQDYEPNAWTLPFPMLRDRDMLVRFDFADNIEFIYEVLNVSREKLMFRKFGRQKMALKRMDKTDIIYTFDFTLGV